MINTKKLSLTEAKKPVLIACLAHTADKLDRDSRRIYDSTVDAVRAADDRVYLTEAQVEITRFAIRNTIAGRVLPETGLALASDMLAQLTMTRRAYAAKPCDGTI